MKMSRTLSPGPHVTAEAGHWPRGVRGLTAPLLFKVKVSRLEPPRASTSMSQILNPAAQSHLLGLPLKMLSHPHPHPSESESPGVGPEASAILEALQMSLGHSLR